MLMRSYLRNLVCRLIAAASAFPADELKQLAAAQAQRSTGFEGWHGGPYRAGTATTWLPPVGAYFARGSRSKWKRARRVRG